MILNIPLVFRLRVLETAAGLSLVLQPERAEKFAQELDIEGTGKSGGDNLEINISSEVADLVESVAETEKEPTPPEIIPGNLHTDESARAALRRQL